MTTPAPLAATLDPASIGVEIKLRAGAARAVRISPRRRIDAGRLFRGQPAQSAPMAVASIFTLCAASQRVAAEAAVAAAEGRSASLATRARWLRALHAERIAEHLRACVLDAPGDKADPQRRALGGALRAALGAARGALAEGAEAAKLSLALAAAAAEIGAPDTGEAPRGWFAHLLAHVAGLAEVAPFPQGVDFLAFADAGEIHRAMRERRPEFLARPSLGDRCVETGPFARHFGNLRAQNGLLVARLRALLLDFAQSLDALRQATTEEEIARRITTRSEAPGEGFAMVDSPRGFLCHRVELDAAGTISAYDILAPTEWNFHPSGAFAKALGGAHYGAGDPQALVAWLAFAFDPCAPCAIQISEDHHA